ncbi:MAG: dephospho-CoA kinase [Spirulina sp. SIO3F2]|nr:dephospho-CoA kinase [Spirulina sp. SIO3F2]
MQRRLGLTGGIATGKSTVSDYLAHRHHLPVLDADVFAREAVAVGSEILEAITQRYGSTLLQVDGTLNRSQLGQIIFSDPDERVWLEAQIHPYVRDRFDQAIANLPVTTTVVLSIPLLFEAQLTALVSEIWVVSCNENQQLERLMVRNQLTLQQSQQRIQAQLPLVQKCAAADVVLDNSGSRDWLYAQIDRHLASSANLLNIGQDK